MSFTTADQLAVATIRTLAIDAVEEAQSGHAGLPLGAAPMAYVLWSRFLKHNPHNPKWENRDRFILSAGHGSMLLYALLHLSGYGLDIADLRSFRQLDSRTPGHPELGVTPGVEATTGPLGQGFAMGVGMAMAERFLAAQYNKPGHDIVDHYTYVLCGDGCLMEGVTAEAASLAGHLGLGKLIVLYDSNGVCQDGFTDTSFTENVAMRFESYGWRVLQVEDGNDLDAIERAIQSARDGDDRPTLVEVRTVIGYGAPHKQGTHDAHFGPLGSAEESAAKQLYGWPYPRFHVPEEVKSHFAALGEAGAAHETTWNQAFAAYQSAYPELATDLQHRLEGRLDVDWANVLPVFDKAKAGREAFAEVIEHIAPHLPSLMGGSADLAASNRTWLQGESLFGKQAYDGRNVAYGVREHAMGSIMNGMALHGGVTPYAGTFLVFSDYMRPAIRMAALMELPVLYVFTHDSLAVGEDGPTHQPVEQLTALRCIPGLTVFRPADAREVAYSVRFALTHNGPTALALSRQTLPLLDEVTVHEDDIARGGYVVLPGGDDPDLILMATGSELQLAVSAAQELSEEGLSVRVVSMPCMELFNEQDAEYRNAVLPIGTEARVAVEMADPTPWFRYVGLRGDVVGVERYGASGKGPLVAERYGFTVDNVVQTARRVLANNAHVSVARA